MSSPSTALVEASAVSSVSLSIFNQKLDASAAYQGCTGSPHIQWLGLGVKNAFQSSKPASHNDQVMVEKNLRSWKELVTSVKTATAVQKDVHKHPHIEMDLEIGRLPIVVSKLVVATAGAGGSPFVLGTGFRFCLTQSATTTQRKNSAEPAGQYQPSHISKTDEPEVKMVRRKFRSAEKHLDTHLHEQYKVCKKVPGGRFLKEMTDSKTVDTPRKLLGPLSPQPGGRNDRRHTLPPQCVWSMWDKQYFIATVIKHWAITCFTPPQSVKYQDDRPVQISDNLEMRIVRDPSFCMYIHDTSNVQSLFNHIRKEFPELNMAKVVLHSKTKVVAEVKKMCDSVPGVATKYIKSKNFILTTSQIRSNQSVQIHAKSNGKDQEIREVLLTCKEEAVQPTIVKHTGRIWFTVKFTTENIPTKTAIVQQRGNRFREAKAPGQQINLSIIQGSTDIYLANHSRGSLGRMFRSCDGKESTHPVSNKMANTVSIPRPHTGKVLTRHEKEGLDNQQTQPCGDVQAHKQRLTSMLQQFVIKFWFEADEEHFLNQGRTISPSYGVTYTGRQDCPEGSETQSDDLAEGPKLSMVSPTKISHIQLYGDQLQQEQQWCQSTGVKYSFHREKSGKHILKLRGKDYEKHGGDIPGSSYTDAIVLIHMGVAPNIVDVPLDENLEKKEEGIESCDNEPKDRHTRTIAGFDIRNHMESTEIATLESSSRFSSQKSTEPTCWILQPATPDDSSDESVSSTPARVVTSSSLLTSTIAYSSPALVSVTASTFVNVTLMSLACKVPHKRDPRPKGLPLTGLQHLWVDEDIDDRHRFIVVNDGEAEPGAGAENGGIPTSPSISVSGGSYWLKIISQAYNQCCTVTNIRIALYRPADLNDNHDVVLSNALGTSLQVQMHNTCKDQDTAQTFVGPTYHHLHHQHDQNELEDPDHLLHHSPGHVHLLIRQELDLELSIGFSQHSTDIWLPRKKFIPAEQVCVDQATHHCHLHPQPVHVEEQHVGGHPLQLTALSALSQSHNLKIYLKPEEKEMRKKDLEEEEIDVTYQEKPGKIFSPHQEVPVRVHAQSGEQKANVSHILRTNLQPEKNGMRKGNLEEVEIDVTYQKPGKIFSPYQEVPVRVYAHSGEQKASVSHLLDIPENDHKASKLQRVAAPSQNQEQRHEDFNHRRVPQADVQAGDPLILTPVHQLKVHDTGATHWARTWKSADSLVLVAPLVVELRDTTDGKKACSINNNRHLSVSKHEHKTNILSTVLVIAAKPPEIPLTLNLNSLQQQKVTQTHIPARSLTPSHPVCRKDILLTNCFSTSTVAHKTECKNAKSYTALQNQQKVKWVLEAKIIRSTKPGSSAPKSPDMFETEEDDLANGSQHSIRIIHFRTGVLLQATAHKARLQVSGSSQHCLQVQIIDISKANMGAAYNCTGDREKQGHGDQATPHHLLQLHHVQVNAQRVGGHSDIIKPVDIIHQRLLQDDAPQVGTILILVEFLDIHKVGASHISSKWVMIWKPFLKVISTMAASNPILDHTGEDSLSIVATAATSGHNHQDNLPAGVEVLVDQQEHKLVLFLQLDEHVQGHEEHGGAHNPSDDDLVQSLEQKHHRGYQQGSLEGYQVHNDRNLKWDNRIQHQPHLSQPGDLLAMAGHQRAHDVTPALQARNVHVQHITHCNQHFERQELCCHYAQPPRHDHNHYPLCQGQQEKAVQVCQGPVRAAQVRLVHHQLSHWESQQNKMYQQALHYRPDKGAQAGHFLLLGGHDGQVSLYDVGDEQPHHPEESPELGHHPYHVHKGAGQQEHNDDISTSGLVQLVKALPHQHHRPQVDNEDQQAEVTPVNVENMFLGLFFSSTCLLSLKTRITADRQHQNHEISPNQEDVQGQFVTAESMPLRLQEVMHCVYTCGTHSGSDFGRELKSADDKPHPGPLVAEYGRSSLSQQENEFSKFVSLSITVTTSTANTWVKVNTASHISILVYRLDKTSYSLDEVDVTVIFDSELSMPKSNTRHQPPIHKLRCSRSYSLSSEILQSEDGMDHTADKVRVTILVSNESSLTTAVQSSLVNNIQEHGSGYLLPIQCLQHETGQREGNFRHRGHGDVLVPVHDNGDVPHRAGGGQALPHRQHYDKSLCQASRTHLQLKSLITFSEDVIVKMSEDGLVYVGANTMLTVAMLVGSVMYSLPAYSIITVNAIKLL